MKLIVIVIIGLIIVIGVPISLISFFIYDAGLKAEKKEAEWQERVEAHRLQEEKQAAERLEAEAVAERQERLEAEAVAERIKVEKARESESICHDEIIKERIEQAIVLSNRFYQACEPVQYGSYNDFVIFSDKMQTVENQINLQTSFQAINESILDLIITVENNCQYTEIRDIGIDLKYDFIVMSLCFEEVYEQFGEFPGMELGVWDNDHNPQHNTNNSQCHIFCDSRGYEPDWIIYQEDLDDLLTTCVDDVPLDNSRDSLWCDELYEYALSPGGVSSDSNSQCHIFCDIYGYEPQWAKSMDVYQAAGVCMSIFNNSEQASDDDLSWCYELAGYLVE